MNRRSVVSVLCVFLGCTPAPEGSTHAAQSRTKLQPRTCTERLYALSRQFADATRDVNRQCEVDADCTLVSSDLPCLSSCREAVNVSAEGDYVAARDAVGASCDGTCSGGSDCVQPPQVARCRGGYCQGELEAKE